MADETALPLFVYGTLRRKSRHPVARRLWESGTDLGEARVRGRIYLIRGYPGWRPAAAEGEWVEGDLIVPGVSWGELDDYEGEEYERIRLEAWSQSAFRPAWIYAYRFEPPSGALLRGGRFPL